MGLPSSTADSVAESNVLREPAPTLHLLLESRRDPPVVALRLPPANGFDPSGIRCPELRFEGSLEDEGDLKTGWKVDSHKGWPQNSQSSGAGL